jgi:diguanylate cyclase (GGDEF)-like protein
MDPRATWTELAVEVVELRARVRELEKENETLGIDSLTGLPTRRALDQAVKTEWARAHRSDTSMAVLMIDIDHFKRFNDTHGHQAGDRVLEHVGQAIQDLKRESDYAGRYGGEEFMFVLGGIDVPPGPEARLAAERIRGAIELIEIPGLPQVTCSIGVACWAGETTVEELIEHADQALYFAKDAGRNRVEEFSSGD